MCLMLNHSGVPKLNFISDEKALCKAVENGADSMQPAFLAIPLVIACSGKVLLTIGDLDNQTKERMAFAGTVREKQSKKAKRAAGIMEESDDESGSDSERLEADVAVKKPPKASKVVSKNVPGGKRTRTKPLKRSVADVDDGNKGGKIGRGSKRIKSKAYLEVSDEEGTEGS